MIARAPVLDRLTASELFLLLWDDYDWSNDIGRPAVCGGASLLGRGGRVRIEAVRERPQRRVHLVAPVPAAAVPARLGLGWPLWVDAPGFDLAGTSGSIWWPLPAARPSRLLCSRTWGGGWTRPGRCGSCGCSPARQTGG